MSDFNSFEELDSAEQARVKHVRDEEKIAQYIRATHYGLRDIQRPTGTELNDTTATALQALELAQQTAEDLAAAGVGEVSTPAAPANLHIVSSTATFTPIGVTSVVEFSWEPVTLSVDGEPIEITEYQLLRDGVLFAVTTSNSVTVSFNDPEAHEYRVQAVSVNGAVSDASEPVSFTPSAPEQIAAAPTAPILRTGFGVVAARWDGEYTTTPPADSMLAVQVEVSINDSEWLAYGARLTADGEIVVTTAKLGDTVHVRLKGFDRLGRETGLSETAEINVNGVQADDVDAASIWASEAWLNILRAGVIEADMIHPNVGESLNLSANESIVMLVGGQETLAEQVGEIGMSAQAAAGAALLARQRADSVNQSLTSHQAVFKVTENGAQVLSRDGKYALELSPGAIEIKDSGVAVSSWQGSRFTAHELISNRAEVGSHKHEGYGIGRTVIRPL